jgi:hypothetical protein
MNIKFNHIQDLGDARYAAAMLANYIGFAIDGEFAVAPATVQEIIGWCAGPKLILEIHETPDISKIQSWIDVLPVDGIECSQNHVETLKSQFEHLNLEWLILNNTFPIITPSKESAQTVLNQSIDTFSIDCFKETQLGQKDYELWNDFFDLLDLP